MGVLTDTRLGLMRYTTSSYIADDPISISLSRKVKVEKPSGGHDKVSVAISQQNFRLISQSASDGLQYSTTDDSATRQYSYILLGGYDADVQVDDTWTETAPDGSTIQYHVDGVIAENGFETRAAVTAFATEPIHG